MVLFQDIISLGVFKCIGVHNNSCLKYMYCNMKMSLTLTDNVCILLFRKQYYVKHNRPKPVFNKIVYYIIYIWMLKCITYYKHIFI